MGTEATGNRILDFLPPDERPRILRHARREQLPLKRVLLEEGEPTTRVHFLTSGVASILATSSNGASVELATVGNEGIVGVAPLLGNRRIGNQRAIMQIPGESLHVDADLFEAELAEHGKLRDLVGAYTLALIVQIGQGVACNRLHSIEERCARWLLMNADRFDGTEIPITQEFLAQMMGVRRPSVTVATGMLVKAGFIEHRRGKVRIIDREGLEGSTCECYEIVKREYERLLPPAAG